MSIFSINFLILVCIFIIMYCFIVERNSKPPHITVDVILIDDDSGRIKDQCLCVSQYMPWVNKIWILTKNNTVSLSKSYQKSNVQVVKCKTLDLQTFVTDNKNTIASHIFFLDSFVLPIQTIQISDLYSSKKDKFRVFNVMEQQYKTISLRNIYQDISPVFLIDTIQLIKSGNIDSYLLHQILNNAVVYAPFLNHTHLIIKNSALDKKIQNCDCRTKHLFATYLYQKPIDSTIHQKIDTMFNLQCKQF